MAWLYLITAGLLEIGFAVSLRESHGFTRLWPSVAVFFVGAASLFFLAMALRTLPVGSSYAIWTGIGTAGTALVGVYLFGESGNLLKSLSILAILGGVVGLRLSGGD